jgi:Na+-transporting NADH:ubiquinone oxidoreductase subunit C
MRILKEGWLEMQVDTPTRTIGVAFILCVVFSLLVSTTAIMLKDKQDYNKEIDLKKNILLAAGLIQTPDVPATEVESIFTNVEPVVVNLQTGTRTELEPSEVSLRNDVKVNDKSNPIENDIAGLSRVPKNAVIYLVKDAGALSGVIIPVVSKGLWSTMYGFMALNKDAKTVKGFGYYEHGETPGLGGEVDNPTWKKQWIGKLAYDESFNPKAMLKKGVVSQGESGAEYMVDGLSGATITANGVNSSLTFWLGQNGFGPFLAKVRNGEF